MGDLLLLLLIVGLHGYWIYKLTTYDWTKYDEDWYKAKDELF